MFSGDKKYTTVTQSTYFLLFEADKIIFLLIKILFQGPSFDLDAYFDAYPLFKGTFVIAQLL